MRAEVGAYLVNVIVRVLVTAASFPALEKPIKRLTPLTVSSEEVLQQVSKTVIPLSQSFPQSLSSRHSRSPMHEDADAVTDTFIKAVATEIKGHDMKYEETLREFEKNNKYNFIFHRSVSYTYKLLISTQLIFSLASKACLLSRSH
jgi:hypothetical protein